uniref:Large ribosomal subunit protein bL17m n=1 Tax=Parascaris univalens TaxID=6257 RepID=A0A914ZL05_PARUN
GIYRDVDLLLIVLSEIYARFIRVSSAVKWHYRKMACSSRISSSLPRIRATIGHIPQKLKTERIDINRSRLEILRRLVTRLVREERCEFPLNRAVEVRQYMERLLQLGIFRERDDPYMNEMVDWWLIEGDLREKFFDVLVPRFAHDPDIQKCRFAMVPIKTS